MRILKLLENNSLDTIKLTDLYSYDELHDTTELLGHVINDYGDNILDDIYEIKTLNPDLAKKTLCSTDGNLLIDNYNNYATNKQKDLIQFKLKVFDHIRIIVLDNNIVIDGQHHAIAAMLSNKSIKYIDISEPIETSNEKI